MNKIYQYSYSSGLQFVSTAEPLLIGIALSKHKVTPEIPKLIGVWKYKKMKNQNKQQ